MSTVTKITNCKFAIKGSGHAPAPGFANINNGVTLAMTNLSSVSVNADHSIASVGAGASWLDVYQCLDPLGKTVAGARNGQVGVAGLTLGGGISYYAPQVGFTCDTVKTFEVVLPSAKIVSASAISHPDLFTALKGGANNFGVVTRIDFSTIPTGQILGGSLAQNISDRSRIFTAFANIAGSDHYDVHASIVTGLSFNSTSKVWGIGHNPIYTLPDPNPPVYRELFSIPYITSTLKVQNLSTLANEHAIPQFNWIFLTSTYGVSADLMETLFDIANATLYPFSAPGDNVFWSFAFEPLPSAITSHGAFPGANPNVLGLSPSDGKDMVLLFSLFWFQPASAKLVRRTAEGLLASWNEAAQQKGLFRDFQYANYADPSQDPFASYGALSDIFLKGVAARYDPKGVFQKKVPGGFKLYDRE